MPPRSRQTPFADACLGTACKFLKAAEALSLVNTGEGHRSRISRVILGRFDANSTGPDLLRVVRAGSAQGKRDRTRVDRSLPGHFAVQVLGSRLGDTWSSRATVTRRRDRSPGERRRAGWLRSRLCRRGSLAAACSLSDGFSTIG